MGVQNVYHLFHSNLNLADFSIPWNHYLHNWLLYKILNRIYGKTLSCSPLTLDYVQTYIRHHPMIQVRLFCMHEGNTTKNMDEDDTIGKKEKKAILQVTLIVGSYLLGYIPMISMLHQNYYTKGSTQRYNF